MLVLRRKKWIIYVSNLLTTLRDLRFKRREKIDTSSPKCQKVNLLCGTHTHTKDPKKEKVYSTRGSKFLLAEFQLKYDKCNTE